MITVVLNDIINQQKMRRNSMTKSNADELIRTSFISKKEVFDIVYHSYNYDIPTTEELEADMGLSDAYEDESDLISDEFKAKRKKIYLTIKRYLDYSKTPLRVYWEDASYKTMPLVVAAMFASLIDLTKGEELTLKSIKEMVCPPLENMATYTFNSNLFLRFLKANLQIFFGLSNAYSYKYGNFLQGMDRISPNIRLSYENNQREAQSISYQHLLPWNNNDNPLAGEIADAGGSSSVSEMECSPVNGVGLITDVERVQVTSSQKPTDREIKAAIDNFTGYYKNRISEQCIRKKEAKDILVSSLERLRLEVGVEEIEQKTKAIRNVVFYAYGLNPDREDELERIFPIDYLEPKFDDYHIFRESTNDKFNFYKTIFNTEQEFADEFVNAINVRRGGYRQHDKTLKRRIEGLKEIIEEIINN